MVSKITVKQEAEQEKIADNGGCEGYEGCDPSRPCYLANTHDRTLYMSECGLIGKKNISKIDGQKFYRMHMLMEKESESVK